MCIGLVGHVRNIVKHILLLEFPSTMSRRVLVSCPLIHDSIEAYDSIFTANDIKYDVPSVEQHLSEEELLQIIDRYDGVIAGDDEFTADVFDEASSLDIVVKWGIGTDNIDQTAAAEHGITVQNTPGAFSDEVADLVVGYAVMLTRELHHIDAAVRDGDWYAPQGISLAEKTLGIVGVGNIGAEVAKRADAMEMNLVGYDVEPIDESLQESTGLQSVTLETLLTESDLVTLHCPLNSITRNLIDESAIEAIGEDGYLINTSRGNLVVEDALVTALENGDIAGAALDVFETEPLPADDPLTKFDSVILGSHNAQNTVEAVSEVHDRAVQALLDGFGASVDIN